MTPAHHGDVVWLDDLPIEPGSFHVLDRGYVDSRRLRLIHQAGAFFVIRERPDVRPTSPRPGQSIAPPRCAATSRSVSMAGTAPGTGPN